MLEKLENQKNKMKEFNLLKKFTNFRNKKPRMKN